MNLSKRVQKYSAPGVSMYSFRSSIPELAILEGSFDGGPSHMPENPILPGVVAGMLKEGTKRKSKEKIRELLEARGAQLEFTSSGPGTHFSLVALASDVPALLPLLEELLTEPAFSPGEWKNVLPRFIAATEEVKQDTNDMARNTLERAMYRSGHPHYDVSPDEAIALLKKMTPRDMAAFHKKFYLRTPISLAFAGPDDDKLIRSILRIFENSKAVTPVLSGTDLKPVVSATEQNVFIKDKTSVTYALGMPVPLKKYDPDFLAFRVGVEALGGGFAARLMQEVREKRGLTYGTYANIRRAWAKLPGYFTANATFAPQLLKEGEEAVRESIERWWKDGLDEQELAERKETIRGSYAVYLSSIRSQVRTLLSLLEDKKEPAYLDQFMADLDHLSLAEVNAAIRKYFDPTKLVTVRAGSIFSGSNKL